MSFIVCSNQASEEDIVGTDSSIFKPYNFRNALSSTMKIPKNAQISLQSAKINLDGTIVLGSGAKFFYLYLGQGIQGALTTFNRLESIQQSTAYPIKVKMYEENNEQVKVNSYQLGEEIAKSLNRYVYNPQYYGRVEVVQKNTNNVFDGYEIKFKGELSANAGNRLYNALPENDTAVEGLRSTVRRGTAAAGWTYLLPPGVDEGVFNVAQNRLTTQHVTFNVPPIAHKRGIFRVHLTDAYVSRGAANRQCDFAVGLSRSVVTEQEPGQAGGPQYLNPPYYSYYNGDQHIAFLKGFLDFGIVVNSRATRGYAAGEIMLVHTVPNSRMADRRGFQPNAPKLNILDYENCPQSDFAAKVNLWNDNMADGFPVHSVEFRVSGEAMSVHLLSTGAAGDGSNGTYYTLIEYDGTQDAEHNLKPISQDCWALYPHLMIYNNRTDPADANKSLGITHYTSIYDQFIESGYAGSNAWALYDPADEHIGLNVINGNLAGGWLNDNLEGGWRSWEAEMVKSGNGGAVTDIMNRAFINRGSDIFTAGAPNPVEYDDLVALGGDASKTVWKYSKPVLILQESDRYEPSQGAQFKRLLGFENTPVVDFFTFGQGADDLNYIVGSTSPPRLVSSKSIFVRIHNFTQESMNAFQGNVSKIIAHLPRFDGTNISGPLYLEPRNMVYLDLNNTEELNVNSFDISLCYSDETYADSLTGTTILCLHVRKKGDGTV